MNFIYTLAGLLVLVFLYYCVLEAITSRNNEDGEK